MLAKCKDTEAMDTKVLFRVLPVGKFKRMQGMQGMGGAGGAGGETRRAAREWT